MTIDGGISLLFVELYRDTFPPKTGMFNSLQLLFIDSTCSLKSPIHDFGSPKFRQFTIPEV